MNSPKSLNPLLIVLILFTITIAADTKEAKISNYSPGQLASTKQLNNNQPRVTSYFIPVSLNLNKTNYSDQIGDVKLEFLKAHNGVRQRYGLTPLEWDAKLARYSTSYAANRHDDCDLVHSTGEYGENIFWGSGNEWTPTEVVNLWVREHRYYNRKTNECQSGQMCVHYTQIVWRNTRHVGCTKIECATGDTFAICNYDPPGNYIGERPFEYSN